MNDSNFIGRIVADPELKETASGVAICRFSLAVKRDYTNKNEADFPNFVAFKSNAKYISSYAKKGMLCRVRASFQTFVKNGNDPAQKPENGYNFVVDKFEILSTKEEMKRYNNKEEVESVPQRKPKMQAYEDNEPTPFDSDTMIPFWRLNKEINNGS